MPQHSAEDALAWMEHLQQQPDSKFLYRGQKQVYPTIKASITRLCEETKRKMWTIVRHYCARGAAHVAGHYIDNYHDRLSILQHYIVCSPLIDLTGTPRIALYFAITHAEAHKTCVVYAIDRRSVTSDDVVFSDHDFLALPIAEGGDMHRWLRQDGYTVGPRSCWWNPQAVEEFDMLELPGVQSFEFTRQDGDERLVEELGDLETVGGDPLSATVRGGVQGIARSLDLWDGELAKILARTATVDPDARLRARIKSVAKRARELNATGKLRLLEELEQSANINVWDTGYECGLLKLERELDMTERNDGG